MPWNVPAQVSASVITLALWPMNLSGDPLDPARHLGGGPAGEGQKKDATWIGSIDDQMSHAVGQGIGLARSRTCDHQERARRSWVPPVSDTVFYRPALFRVELVEITDRDGH